MPINSMLRAHDTHCPLFPWVLVGKSEAGCRLWIFCYFVYARRSSLHQSLQG